MLWVSYWDGSWSFDLMYHREYECVASIITDFLTTVFVEEARAPQPGKLAVHCRFTVDEE